MFSGLALFNYDLNAAAASLLDGSFSAGPEMEARDDDSKVIVPLVKPNNVTIQG